MVTFEWVLRDYDRRDVKQLWICDSWHVTELIMGRYRNKELLTDSGAKHIEMLLTALGALKIIVSESPSTIEDRLVERGSRTVASEHVGMIWDLFNEWATINSWRRMDSTKIRPERLIKWAKDAQIEALKVASMRSYVGSLTPQFLVLSGSRSWPMGTRDFLAALTPVRAVPRNVAIMEALLPYDDFGILSQDSDQIKTAWVTLGKPPVIATDPAAKAACVIAGIPVTPIRAALVIMAEASA
jgi:hypothetical protein